MREEPAKIFKDIYKGNNESLQIGLLALKNMGCAQVEIVNLLMNELGLSLRESDSIVLNSDAWQAERDETLRLRDIFGNGLSE